MAPPNNLGPAPLPVPSGIPLGKAGTAQEVDPAEKESDVDVDAEEGSPQAEAKVTSMTDAIDALRETRRRAQANAKKTRMTFAADAGALKTRRLRKS